MTGKPNTSRLAEHAYEAVRDAIERGELAPGDRISEYKTADWLNISRTPAREGLLRLQAEGLLAHHPRRGLVVASIDSEALKEIFVARELMERSLAGQAARNASGPELDQLMRLVEAEAGMAEDREAMIRHNREFHGHIRTCAHNRYLLKFTGTLEDIVAADRRGTSLVDLARRHAVIEEHRALAEAIVARDVAKSEDRAAFHIRQSYAARLKLKMPEG
ncbi:GntR family transcriptional regulator [Pseudooceanicola sp.]|uniref:GntR family transcriptional regulator n=1 Tax=Pseudooceanicola sp. TaxID=1914328 RepID=UPI0035C6DB89